MIQYRLVRGLPWLLAIVSAATAARAAPPGHAVAVWWQPPGDLAQSARARAAFADAAQRRGASFVDATEPARTPPSLVPALDAALADWAAFRFADALAKLDELARLADARGGGDLDQRQLGEIYLYRGLCRLEVGPAEAAWDDLVRAARLDPTRVIDPARFPPRAVAAYRRAAVEVTERGRVALEVAAPPGAALALDGHAFDGAATVPVGTHFVAVDAAGYEPWAAVVDVSGAHERLQPPLRPYQPPDADRLVALTAARAPRQILAGALVRGDHGWSFVARELTLPDGKMVSHAVALADTPIAVAVEGAVARVAPLLTALPPAAAPKKSRWWIWAAAGGLAATLAVVIPVSIVYSSPSPTGTIGGSLGTLH